jgi:hypothetical protein
VLELIVQQTNSTVTATFLQRTSGASFFDWITNALFQTTVTDWITVAVTVALVYYARVTILEGNKARRAESIERQLSRLYNPMFEILGGAEELQLPERGRIVVRLILKTNVAELWRILGGYGHFLDRTQHDKMRTLLSFERSIDDRHLGFPDDANSAVRLNLDANYNECYGYIKQKRNQLMNEYKKLTGEQKRSGSA